MKSNSKKKKKSKSIKNRDINIIKNYNKEINLQTKIIKDKTKYNRK